MTETNFQKMLQGYGLTTAEILYRMPDYKNVLQTYIWQEYDIFPELPSLRKFLFFWETKLDGPLVSVQVAHQKLITPMEFRIANAELKIN